MLSATRKSGNCRFERFAAERRSPSSSLFFLFLFACLPLPPPRPYTPSRPFAPTPFVHRFRLRAGGWGEGEGESWYWIAASGRDDNTEPVAFSSFFSFFLSFFPLSLFFSFTPERVGEKKSVGIGSFRYCC
jgi:hypothetical protein